MPEEYTGTGNQCWTVTVERTPATESQTYMFSEPHFIGKSYYIDTESPFSTAKIANARYVTFERRLDYAISRLKYGEHVIRLDMPIYQSAGPVIAHTAALARIDFT